MKLSQYSKQNSISYQTAWNHFNKGLIDGVYQLESGTTTVPDSIIVEETTEQLIKELESNE